MQSTMIGRMTKADTLEFVASINAEDFALPKAGRVAYIAFPDGRTALRVKRAAGRAFVYELDLVTFG